MYSEQIKQVSTIFFQTKNLEVLVFCVHVWMFRLEGVGES